MWATILAVCGGFTVVCVAVTHGIKVIHGISETAKKPWERVHSRLDALEKGDEKILAMIESSTVQQVKNDQITARLELLNLVQHYPKNDIAINNAYDEYTTKGWNSYIHEIIADWRKEQDDEREKHAERRS